MLEPIEEQDSTTADPNRPLDNLISEAYEHDPVPQEIINMIKQGAQRCKNITLSECTIVEDRLFYDNHLYVPNHGPLKIKLLQLYHNNPTAGHPGRSKTITTLGRDYYWPGLHRYVEMYVRNCNICQWAKPSWDKYHGRIKLIPTPEHRSHDISMDFVGELPASCGYNAIFVVMDQLTKMRHLIPCKTTLSALNVANMFLWNVFKLHGLPETIISDRRTQFVTKFWKHLCKRLQIQAKLLTAYHLETDGQTERFNAVMEQYLRCYVAYQQDNWSTWLPMAEFTANNHNSAATSISPFAANYGFNPQSTTALPVTTNLSTPNSRA